MKAYIASILRHVFTGFAVLGTWLAAHDLIDPSDVASVNGAGMSLGAALVVILSAIIGRFLITGLGKIFPGMGKTSGSAGGQVPLWMLGTGMAAGLMGLSLPSCSPQSVAAIRAIPIRTCVYGPDGGICYSRESGIEIKAIVFTK